MGDDDTPDGLLSGATRRSFLNATAATASIGSVAVAGCLGRAGTEGSIVMTGDTAFADIMHADEGPSVQEALWDAGLDEDITVEVRAGVDDSVQRMQSAQSALQAGRAPPDIIMMDSGWTIPFILREQTAPLGDHLSSDVVDRVESTYLDASLETARHPEDDDLHALPLFVDFGMMLYRRDLLEEAGFDGDDWETDPPDWQTFAETVAEARDEAGVDHGFTTQAASYEGLSCCTFNEAMTTWGGSYFGGRDALFTAGDREVTVEDEPVVDAIRMMRAFIAGGDDPYAHDDFPRISPTAIVQWSEGESLGPFEGGEAVAHRNWPFAIAETGGDEAFGEDLGVTPMPHQVSVDDAPHQGAGGPAAALGGWHLTLNPYTERLDEAAQVLEAFTDEDVMLTIFELQGYLPPTLELVEEADPDEIGPIARYVDQIQIAGEHAIPRPVSDLWPEQSAVIAREVHGAYRGEKSPEDAMADLAARLRRSEEAVADQERGDGGDGGDGGDDGGEADGD